MISFGKQAARQKVLELNLFSHRARFFEKNRFGEKLPQQIGIFGSQNIRRKVLELNPVSCRACFSDKTRFLDIVNSSAFCSQNPMFFRLNCFKNKPLD